MERKRSGPGFERGRKDLSEKICVGLGIEPHMEAAAVGPSFAGFWSMLEYDLFFCLFSVSMLTLGIADTLLP